MARKMQTKIVNINEAPAAGRAIIPVSLNMNVRGMGLSAILGIIEQYCGRVIEGASRIAEWARSR